MSEYAKFGPQVIGSQAKELCDEALALDIIDRTVRLVGEYHPKTAVHMLEVSRILAVFMTSNVVDYSHEEQLQLIRTGALHDVGKLVSVPLRILDSSSPLTSDEWALIKQHPETGFRLAHIHELGAFALPILLHHELQPNRYGIEYERNRVLAEFGESKKSLVTDDRKVWIDTTLLAVADQYDARYPLSRSYNGKSRLYNVEDLEMLVKSDFIEAGRVRELGLIGFLDKAVTIAQELAMASRHLPVRLQPHGQEPNQHHVHPEKI